MNILKSIIDFIKRLFGFFISEDENKINRDAILYKKKPLLTYTEKVFYLKLKKLEQIEPYKVIPQINLCSIIQKLNHNKYRNELYRNIDFGVFDENFNPLLLIELNDSSHKEKHRKSRDLKVKKLCEQAGLKLITFYTSYPNEESYIINRVQKEIDTTPLS